jgi:transcriptional regulator with XRE-family HTH domain
MVAIIENKRKEPRMAQQKFPDRLREIREAKGITQQELADLVKVTRVTLSRWEMGIREPNVTYFFALCEALGVSCEEFTRPPKKPRKE